MSEKAESNIVLRVGGKMFRCPCGCNVFHTTEENLEWYVCNACGLTYEGEDVEPKEDPMVIQRQLEIDDLHRKYKDATPRLATCFEAGLKGGNFNMATATDEEVEAYKDGMKARQWLARTS